MQNLDHDSKAALRVRCPACGRMVAHHPFCERCGKPQLCGSIWEAAEDICGGCAVAELPRRQTKPTGTI
jgi:ribosomal protein L32